MYTHVKYVLLVFLRFPHLIIIRKIGVNTLFSIIVFDFFNVAICLLCINQV